MKILILTTIFGILMLNYFNANADEKRNEFLRNYAKEFYLNLQNNQPEKSYKLLADTMQKLVKPEQFNTFWGQMTSSVGKFESFGEMKVTAVENNHLILINLLFEKYELIGRLTVSPDNMVVGFFITPGKSRSEAKNADYSDISKFSEEDIRFGIDDFPLDGKITLPKSDKPSPAVILVHGSGPNDMDESVGGSKPFRDIAYGLSTSGIAVIRYNKRTNQHPDKVMKDAKTFDLDDEIIDDVLEAVKFARNNAKKYNIDTNKIFVLGHSLGAAMMPRVALRDSRLAGIIIMAGFTRKFEDILLDQYEYIFKLDDDFSVEEQAEVNKLKEQMKNYLSPELDADTDPTTLPMGMNGAYAMDLRSYNPAETAKSVKMPMFIIQGERDYQVTVADFNGWKSALSDNPLVSFKLYPKLNHLFISGEGKSIPSEYVDGKNMDGEVIRDLIDWIKKN